MRSTGVLLALAGALLLGCQHGAAEEDTGGDARAKYPFTITVPDAGWRVEVEDVYEGRGKLLVLAELLRGSDMAPQVITERVVPLVADVERGLFLEVYVIGKTWTWENNNPNVTFIEDREPFLDLVEEQEAFAVSDWEVKAREPGE